MSLLGEIKRRKVFQVAAVYLVVAWLIMQVVDVVSGPLLLPDLFARIVILVLAIGFPIALILSWAFDLTPEGVVRDEGSTVQSGGRRIEYVLIGLLVAAVGWLTYRVEMTPSESVVEVVAEDVQRDVLPNSIAVLPFDNLSLDPEDAFFAAGIHDSTLSQLAQLRDLSVIARTSVMQYKEDPPPITEIAEALNVAMVMEGSVRYANDRVLITAQLIDGRTGTLLWANEYEGDLTDIFGIQAQIARAIAAAVGAQLSQAEVDALDRPPTNSAEAAQLYFRAITNLPSAGSAAGTPEQRAEIQDDLDRAISADPNFALAYALKAWVYADSMSADPSPRDDWPQNQAALYGLIEEYAGKALALDPTAGLAYGALAQGLFYSGRWAAARDAYENALEISPNDSTVLAWHLTSLWALGRVQQSVVYAERLAQVDPNHAFGQRQRALAYHFAGRYGDAVEANRRSIELDPADAITYLLAAMPEIARGNQEVALDLTRQGEKLFPDRGLAGVWGHIAYAYRVLGETEDAERAYDRYLETTRGLYVARGLQAWAYLGVAEYDNALRVLYEAAEDLSLERNPFPLIAIRENLYSDPILDQPEFVEVRSRLRLRE